MSTGNRKSRYLESWEFALRAVVGVAGFGWNPATRRGLREHYKMINQIGILNIRWRAWKDSILGLLWIPIPHGYKGEWAWTPRRCNLLVVIVVVANANHTKFAFPNSRSTSSELAGWADRTTKAVDSRNCSFFLFLVLGFNDCMGLLRSVLRGRWNLRCRQRNCQFSDTLNNYEES